jgi:hypothetical protein
MSQVITITTTNVHRAFQNKGYTDEKICSILTGLVSIWRVNENIEDITNNVVMSELEDDDLMAAFLWNSVSKELIETGRYVRELSLKHMLVRWSVVPFAIMLEFEDGPKTT